MKGLEIYQELMKKEGLSIDPDQSIRLANFISGMISVHDFVRKERDEALAKLAAMESQAADKPAVAVPDDLVKLLRAASWELKGGSTVCHDSGSRARGDSLFSMATKINEYLGSMLSASPAPSHSQQSADKSKSDLELIHKALLITGRSVLKDPEDLIEWAKQTVTFDRCPSHESEQP